MRAPGFELWCPRAVSPEGWCLFLTFVVYAELQCKNADRDVPRAGQGFNHKSQMLLGGGTGKVLGLGSQMEEVCLQASPRGCGSLSQDRSEWWHPPGWAAGPGQQHPNPCLEAKGTAGFPGWASWG